MKSKKLYYNKILVLFSIVAVLVLMTQTVIIPSSTPDSQMPISIIWDDDGSADGVIALLYFLQSSDINVKAITVSCGLAHPEIFANNLTRMLARIGRTGIPVASGRDYPLAGANAFPEPWRRSTDNFWGIDLPKPVEPVHSMSAAQLIVDIVNESPDPIMIFISGNHTNLAEALRLDPSIAENIASVAIMGGALEVPGNIESDWPDIHNQVAEWNIWVDSIAASEVFTSGLPITLTPLDATNQIIWTEADAIAWEASDNPEGELAAEILRWVIRSWFSDGVYCWDLVAAVYTTDPHSCQSRQVHLQVVTDPGDQQGRTVIDDNQPANVNACMIPIVDNIKTRVKSVFSIP